VSRHEELRAALYDLADHAGEGKRFVS